MSPSHSMSIPVSAAAKSTAGDAAPAGPVLPAHVLRIYVLAWLPILLIYMVAWETGGVWSRGFNLLSALHGTLRNLGPAFLLLLLLWPLTSWMEAQRFGATRQIAVHAGSAVLFAFAYYALLWLVIAAEGGVAAAESARANWFIWQIQFGMLFYAAAAGAFAAYRAVRRARAEAAATAQIQMLLARSELAALRNKLNPHFLFNTLHSILALVRKDAVRAEQALFGFSEMLRYLLDTERSGDDQVLLRDELAFTEQYLALESIRLGDRLKIDWQVDDEALAVSIPALTVQPLVENSIKHAFNPRSEHGTLTVRVHMAGKRVEITVADDGPGQQLPADGSLPKGDGLGLPTVARRLALRWGEAAGFKVQSAPGAGFQVRLSIPE
jgi:signal transduction histidine kinase